MRQLIAVLPLLLSCPAAARADEPVLLPPEQPPGLADEIERALEDAGHPVKRTTLGMDDLMLAVECSALSVACLQKIGNNLGAGLLVLGQARKTSPGDTLLRLRLFDVASGGDIGRAEALLPRQPRQRRQALARAGRRLFGETTAPDPPRTGTLEVTATVPYVEVLLDGQPRGTAPARFVLPVGRYRVEARLSGHSRWSDTLEIKADAVTRREIELHEVRREPLPRPPTLLESIEPQTWLVAGLGGVCVVAGVTFGANMRAEQNDLDALRGDTFTEIARMEELKRSGERDALVANILFGVGGAALVTAGVMAYLDYRRSRPERAEPATILTVGPGSLVLRGRF